MRPPSFEDELCAASRRVPGGATARLGECRDFYRTWFGFEVAFEASWFVLLTNAADRTLSLAFMAPDHPSSPRSPAPYDGGGSFITLQVADARAEYGAAGGRRNRPH